ncbi:MAG: ribosome recycling factor [Candidatus Zambryskibacteria bacterium]|nr:ribosome recycling factor [Candidatus Zambryskibacteria bacterium]
MEYLGILEWLRNEYAGIRSGQATPAILDRVVVEVYGSPMAINQLATITISDSRSLRIVPWDKTVINSIDSGVRQSNLGVSVVTDSEGLRVSFPQLTAENRQTLLKLAKQKLEDARIKVRNERQKVLDDIEKRGAGEDEQKRFKNELQKSVDEANKKLEELYHKKESELMG